MIKLTIIHEDDGCKLSCRRAMYNSSEFIVAVYVRLTLYIFHSLTNHFRFSLLEKRYLIICEPAHTFIANTICSTDSNRLATTVKLFRQEGLI